ncbi:hypothetical protein [Shewanella surugensis]|uniref:S49 family peptidase n=1 Tax=Shewanella surugensis TaxID=212020 RepID=A0ABT0L9X5_9GAMM|nr:hypothetical protein [Shewanella surugensis]MCL1124152.1 hypothetical protein [Shewanella surugensis]
MARNLAHIANVAFNRPIALEPGYARVFYSVLASEIGIGRLIDGMTGEVLDSQGMIQLADSYSYEDQVTIDDNRDRYYKSVGGIAIIPVDGTLVHKFGYLQPRSGMTGYDGLISRIQFAIKDPSIKGILVDFDTPGGQVSGCFDAMDMIARLRSEKPIWSLGCDMHCSAGQALSSACSRRLITQTGGCRFGWCDDDAYQYGSIIRRSGS